MSKIETAVNNALGIANDNSHGYDQTNRWGPDYDCSSLIITAWQNAGVPVKTSGASYTGNMRRFFLACGFKDVTVQVNLTTGYGMRSGDVLLNERSHAAMYVGNGQIVHASHNEFNGITGGRSGDQTGGEICVRPYYNFVWDCVLRYEGDRVETTPAPTDTTTTKEATSDTYTVKAGDSLWFVAMAHGTTFQELAKLNGISAPYTIYPGQVLRLKGSTEAPGRGSTEGSFDAGASQDDSQRQADNEIYTVKAGDTLWGIAAKLLGNGARYAEIQKENGLRSTVIHPGQTLKIPRE